MATTLHALRQTLVLQHSQDRPPEIHTHCAFPARARGTPKPLQHRIDRRKSALPPPAQQDLIIDRLQALSDAIEHGGRRAG
ncbi:MAG: hypothetical protein ACP5GC_04740 [Thiomonas sp.]